MVCPSNLTADSQRGDAAAGALTAVAVATRRRGRVTAPGQGATQVSTSTISYSVSCRGKPLAEPIGPFLSEHFDHLPTDIIDSVFGFVERSTLYGGRPFSEAELSEADLDYLHSHRVGVKLPLSNHWVSEEEYEQNQAFLEKYHHQYNAMVVVNDDLGRWIRRDFPLYALEASVIKDISTHDDIARALEIYQTVVLPMKLNTNLHFLDAIPDKDRIRLFSNGGCAYNCPLKLCYKSFSQMNKFAGEVEFKCSQDLLFRPQLGMLNFDIEKLQQIGFTKFKILRSKGKTGF